MTSPDGSTWRYDRRADGQLATLTPPVGPRRSYEYDSLGRLTRQVVSGTVDDVQASQITTYSHAGATRTMNRRSVAAGVDIVQTTRADGRGRLLWAEYAALGAPAGDIRSRATVYGIDGGVGLVTERLTGGEPDRAYVYSYDGAGRLLSAVEAGQQVDYSDLDLGGGAVGVTVDPVTPDDLPFERHFDLLGRLVSVGAAGDVLGLSWNANGTLAGIDGQGLSESWSDHPSAPHRPVEIELSSVDKSLTYDFSYDSSQPVDGIDWAQAPWLSVTVTEDGVPDTTKYGLDDQWRLTRAEYPPLGGAGATRVEYGLRTDGVRTSETTYTSPDGFVFGRSRLRTYSYSPLDHLRVIDDVVRVNGIAQQVEPAQVDRDGWGRPRVYRVPGQPDREMEWDAEGRMLSMAVVGGDGTSRYAYNWRDQRIRREGPGEYVESLWEGDGLLSEAVTVSGDTDVRTHLRGAGMVLAAGGVRMGHDWLGSPVMLESAGGGFVSRRYDAWGRIVAGHVPVSGGVQVGCAGHAYDPESGLTYAQARYYDPEVGLFLGPDPWDGALGQPGTLSRFVYVGGSPVTKVDPDGRIGSEAERRNSDDTDSGLYHSLLYAYCKGRGLCAARLARQNARWNLRHGQARRLGAVFALQERIEASYDVWADERPDHIPHEMWSAASKIRRYRVEAPRHASADELLDWSTLSSFLPESTDERVANSEARQRGAFGAFLLYSGAMAVPTVGLATSPQFLGWGLAAADAASVSADFINDEVDESTVVGGIGLGLGAAVSGTRLVQRSMRAADATGDVAGFGSRLLDDGAGRLSLTDEAAEVAPKGPAGGKPPQAPSPGVTVKKVGNYYIKEVDPNAGPVARWFGRRSLRHQSEALDKLGDMAPSHLLKNGKLISRDAGVYDGGFWRTWWEGSKRLGTPMNDIRPRNIGAGGKIFDPALDPLVRGLYWTTAATAVGLAGYGIYLAVEGEE